jgi:hypothetical protein
MSSKFFSSRNDNKQDDKFNTKNALSSRTNVKRQTQVKKSGRGK